MDPAADLLNLPAYEAGPPTGARPTWGYKPKPVSADAAAAIGRLRVLQESEGLMSFDLLVAFAERQIVPLQAALIRSSGWADSAIRADCARKGCCPLK